ncbi:hypothetical protein L0664_01740 [Octadecabacter sp. G9-8]|uniref:DUF2029 domain-containing protein n=1 Tax=Octadecabacter dasysiphoniae TaxID=2909341 RepID=A0ABS9CRR2_9RHOB|nr:hypothetical protein [Octadecabacter dasysiphoniae]MCF2869777.1 hypothetical protein [Octadecabacter dasysiphoniae]
MTKSNTTALIAFLCAVLVAMAGAAVLKGGLYVGKHEGDTLHLMEIVLRMAQGQTPHLDFMTPIGALAFWPIAMLVKAGLGIGMAIIWAQTITALIFLPIIVWIARNRLSPWVAALFGLCVIVLLLALVHGEAKRSVSISMHYNRLAWAAAFVAIVAAIVPPRTPTSGNVDGVIVGAMMVVMAMIKVTYFVPFALPVALALFMTGQRRTLCVAVLTGLVLMAGITLLTGVDYWTAYARDLIVVATSEGRSAPGEPLVAIMGSPAYLGGSFLAVGAVILLRQGAAHTGGLILLLLLPGFFYVTYQNFGNDPQWLMLLGVLVLALRDDVMVAANKMGWDIRAALGYVAAMALALTSPSFFNLAYSPFRHFQTDVTSYSPILPRDERHADLQGFTIRLERVDARVALGGQVAGLTPSVDRDPVVEFRGEIYPPCGIELGLARYIDTMVRDLETAGYADGTSVFVADLFSSHWMFGSFEPMDGGAPWYYGGLPGLRDADYVLVPFCPMSTLVQTKVFEIMDEAEVPLSEIRRTGLYILYSIDR